MPTHEPELNVGARVRGLRQALGMSVRTLATKTDFSPSFVSQVENGQTSPSIASLERLARALGVSLVEFFAAVEQTPAHVTRAGEAPELRTSSSRAPIRALGPGGSRLVAMLITLEPGGLSGKQSTASAGDTFAFIVDGEVTLILADRQHVLRRGDAITLAADVPHRWENLGTIAAQILSVSARLSS